MKTHYFIDKTGKYLGAVGDGAEFPADAIEIESPPPIHADQPWLFPGWGPSATVTRQIEDAWRDTEMPLARENRIAIAEMGDDSIPGTAKEWSDYWLALRDWKDGNPDFPDMGKRPIRPS